MLPQGGVDPNAGHSRPFAVYRTLAGLVSAVVIGALLTLGYALSTYLQVDHQQTLERAEQSLMGQAQAQATWLRRALDDYDRDLLTLRDMVADPSNAPEAIQNTITFYHRRSPEMLDILILDAEGGIRFWTHEGLPPDIRDRPYYTVHRESVEDLPYLSPPLPSKIREGAFFISLSRALYTAEGAFDGVAVFVLSVDILADGIGLDLVEVGQSMVAARLDGTVIFRQPRIPGDTGTVLSTLAALGEDPPTRSIGYLISVLDHKERISARHRVEGYPLLVAVTIEKDLVLAQVSQHRDIVFGLYGIGLVLGLVSLGVILRLVRKGIQQTRGVHENAARLQAIVEQNPLAVIEWDLEFRVMQWNAAAERIFGYSAEEAQGRSAEFILPDPIPQDLKETMARLLSTPQGVENINHNRRADGTMIECHWYSRPLLDETGTIRAVLSVAEDITARAIIERDLLRRQEIDNVVSEAAMRLVASPNLDEGINRVLERLGLLTQAGRSYLFLVQDNGDYMDNTHEWCAPDVSAQLDLLKNIPLADFPWWMNKLNEGEYLHIPNVAALGDEAARERDVLQQQGIHSVLVVPLKLPGKILGFIGLDQVGTVKDWSHGDREVLQNLANLLANVIERTRAEKALRTQTEALQSSNTELEQFAYVASHDLRQPLRMVSSYLQLIDRRLQDRLDSETREFMDFARDGARRMDNLLTALLEYSRVGRHGEPMAEINSRLLLEEALRFLSPSILETEAAIEIVGVWPMVRVSRNEGVRLFQNLVGNALKYHQEGRPPRVTLSVESLGTEWLFSIRDNGIGINPQHTKNLFKVFQRLHTQQEIEGTGIGLAVCRKIVERHGGRIWIDSDGEGHGTIFHFILPRCGGTT